jgi:hypothetical protein
VRDAGRMRRPAGDRGTHPAIRRVVRPIRGAHLGSGREGRRPRKRPPSCWEIPPIQTEEKHRGSHKDARLLPSIVNGKQARTAVNAALSTGWRPQRRRRGQARLRRRAPRNGSAGLSSGVLLGPPAAIDAALYDKQCGAGFLQSFNSGKPGARLPPWRRRSTS